MRNRPGPTDPPVRYHLGMRLTLSLFGTLLFAQSTASPPGMQCDNRTLVLFSPGPNAARDKELAPAHFAYMSGQMRSNKVIAGGPFSGGDGAAIVFASSDWNQVQLILKDEPFTSAGVIQVSDHKTWMACQALAAHAKPTAP
jgi:uncharacterized protein YciI